jgi:hypothetical protein
VLLDDSAIKERHPDTKIRAMEFSMSLCRNAHNFVAAVKAELAVVFVWKKLCVEREEMWRQHTHL